MPRRQGTLLNNLATTLMEPFMATGLAARFFHEADDFLILARSFVAPYGFEIQYRDRLKYLDQHGILEAQAPLWQLESECRKAIKQAAALIFHA